MYPTATQYTCAMLDTKKRFATLKNVCAVLDDAGEPIFRAHRHSVLFLAKVDGVLCSLRFFTSTKSLDNYAQLLKNEVYMDNGTRYNVAIHPPFMLATKGDQKVDLVENRAIIQKEGLYGFTDENGEIIVEPKYESVENFSESRAIVSYDGFFGLIDDAGNEIITTMWDEMSYDGSYLCYVERDGLCGVIDRTGKVIVPPIWDWTGEYAQSRLLVEQGGKYGFLNENGEIVIGIKYDDACSFDSHGYATVSISGRQYQIDTQENRV